MRLGSSTRTFKGAASSLKPMKKTFLGHAHTKLQVSGYHVITCNKREIFVENVLNQFIHFVASRIVYSQRALQSRKTDFIGTTIEKLVQMFTYL